MLQQPLLSDWKFLDPQSRRWLAAQVPGCAHTDLLSHDLIPDPYWGRNELALQHLEELDFTYRKTFAIDEAVLAEERVDLVFEGIDTVATIVFNGKELARVDNMFIGYRFDVTRLLKADGENVLEVRFRSPLKEIRDRLTGEELIEWNDPVGGSSLLRKEARSFGWDWGPRFASSGLWKSVYLEAWSENRFRSVGIRQEHSRGKVKLSFTPRMERRSAGKLAGTLSLDGKKIAEFQGTEVVIKDPALWWPNGHGEQPLYTVELRWLDKSGCVIDTWQRKIGLRTIELDRHPDEFGESFQFVVNGRVIFAKGANWIPADSFVARVTREDYDNLLSSAADAHMNMIRVWGGGIYEKEDFYDLCDEKGLLVWQDFMFACALYPGDRPFLASVKAEAAYQVQRLAHRACLALWCGNNEIEQMPDQIVATKARKKAYESVFYRILPEAVALYDGTTTYWPCSPHNPEGYEKGHNNERAGDCHFWDVWHMRKPVSTYEEKNFRFCSEFGMQSYSSPEVAKTYCSEEDMNVFGPVMENHQKNGAGNLIIMDYVSRLYRFPRDYRSLAYLSQLNQAYCMKVGIEHFRRSMPRTMGALYWQLNDCWPVASWSSLEYKGRWKALQYESRRFFAPALLSLKVLGAESIGKNNIALSTVHGVEIHSVYDGLAPQQKARLNWSIETLDGKVLRSGSRKFVLEYGQSVLQETVDARKELAKYGASEIYLKAELVTEDGAVARRTAFFTAQRYLNLKRSPIRSRVKAVSKTQFEVALASKTFHHAVQVNFPALEFRADDNFVDLYAGEERTITITLSEAASLSAVKDQLEIFSLVDSFE
ncbi:beta-mannosidase [Terrimicrobium sacchariphilum]|uniref:Beta-mannosidase B n=1 Tax=Terrimicrobium sacchariphilum TaxID=690879 RepID=A0A146G3X3_TERSA|nr:glycoside hydrolase family 2 protein [Terrimicrobium sacchariphilum]GAT31548.1 beta-mannosidase [Terrimicrobium sacchariphilum]